MKNWKSLGLLWCLLGVLAFSTPSCTLLKKIFIGDPRENCNHPQHGKWVQEQKVKHMK